MAPPSLKKFQRDKIQAWHAHGERFKCEHLRTELRARMTANGGVQFVYQCLQCGTSTSQPVAKAKAFEIAGGTAPPAFDPSIFDERERQRNVDAEAIKTRFRRGTFFASYADYLSSSAWATKRQLVLKRAQGLCEGCRAADATEVHHLTYAHVGNEFLFELVAVCTACHDRYHEDELDEED